MVQDWSLVQELRTKIGVMDYIQPKIEYVLQPAVCKFSEHENQLHLNVSRLVHLQITIAAEAPRVSLACSSLVLNSVVDCDIKSRW